MVIIETGKIKFEVRGVIDGRLKLNVLQGESGYQKPSFKIYRDKIGCYIMLSSYYYVPSNPYQDQKFRINSALKEYFSNFI